MPLPGTLLAVTGWRASAAQHHHLEDYSMAENNIISDQTYNVLAILLSKLEGLEAYDTYLEDMQEGEGRKIIEQIRRDDERHAQLLREHVEKLVKENGLK
jgi:hypothetical protein